MTSDDEYSRIPVNLAVSSSGRISYIMLKRLSPSYCYIGYAKGSERSI